MFIIGLSVCALALILFLVVRVRKGDVEGVLAKTFASFCFVTFALFLFNSKNIANANINLASTLLICGLVCGLIGDILLDLKVVYPFHENKYLPAGMTAFGIGHLFYIPAIILFVSNEVNVFTSYLLPLILLVVGSVVATLLIWLLSTKVLKLNYGKFTWIVNIYSFLLISVTALAVFLAIINTSLVTILLAVFFGCFLLSDLILSTQYFGRKQSNKLLIVLNHLFYYVAQIGIASILYFI